MKRLFLVFMALWSLTIFCANKQKLKNKPLQKRGPAKNVKKVQKDISKSNDAFIQKMTASFDIEEPKKEEPKEEPKKEELNNVEVKIPDVVERVEIQEQQKPQETHMNYSFDFGAPEEANNKNNKQYNSLEEILGKGVYAYFSTRVDQILSISLEEFLANFIITNALSIVFNRSLAERNNMQLIKKMPSIQKINNKKEFGIKSAENIRNIMTSISGDSKRKAREIMQALITNMNAIIMYILSNISHEHNVNSTEQGVFNLLCQRYMPLFEAQRISLQDVKESVYEEIVEMSQYQHTGSSMVIILNTSDGMEILVNLLTFIMCPPADQDNFIRAILMLNESLFKMIIIINGGDPDVEIVTLKDSYDAYTYIKWSVGAVITLGVLGLVGRYIAQNGLDKVNPEDSFLIKYLKRASKLSTFVYDIFLRIKGLGARLYSGIKNTLSFSEGQKNYKNKEAKEIAQNKEKLKKIEGDKKKRAKENEKAIEKMSDVLAKTRYKKMFEDIDKQLEKNEINAIEANAQREALMKKVRDEAKQKFGAESNNKEDFVKYEDMLKDKNATLEQINALKSIMEPVENMLEEKLLLDQLKNPDKYEEIEKKIEKARKDKEQNIAQMRKMGGKGASGAIRTYEEEYIKKVKELREEPKKQVLSDYIQSSDFSNRKKELERLKKELYKDKGVIDRWWNNLEKVENQELLPEGWKIGVK